MDAETLKTLILERLGATFVHVDDTSGGCGAMFEAIIISPLFEGEPLLDRHRRVNNALAEEMKNIHAFSMKTWTPEQWDKKKAKYAHIL